MFVCVQKYNSCVFFFFFGIFVCFFLVFAAIVALSSPSKRSFFYTLLHRDSLVDSGVSGLSIAELCTAVAKNEREWRYSVEEFSKHVFSTALPCLYVVHTMFAGFMARVRWK